MPRPAEAFHQLLEVLDRMEIPYYVGGSVASSAQDVDLVVDLQSDQIEEFTAQLHGDFYADAALIREAFLRGRAANLIHFATAYKFDLFPLRKDEYSRTEFARRAFRKIQSLGPEPIECAVASAEDTILRKIEWYRAAGETSERQWNDLRGILKVSGPKLDQAYLRRWATHLKVDDLLDQLLKE